MLCRFYVVYFWPLFVKCIWWLPGLNSLVAGKITTGYKQTYHESQRFSRLTSWVSLWDSLVTISPTWKPQQPGCSHKQWWNKRFFFTIWNHPTSHFRVSIRGYLWGFREQVMYRWRWLFSWCSTVARLNGRNIPKCPWVLGIERQTILGKLQVS